MDPILSEDIKKELKKEFKSLTGDVCINVFTQKGQNDQFNDFAVTVCKEFSELSDKIHYHQFDSKSEEAKEYELTSSPEILFNPDRYDIRFMGAPLGEEGRSFVATIMMVSAGRGVLSESSLERIKGLKDPREIMVFVTPT
jgi:thioredoxin reductase (NADPH)